MTHTPLIIRIASTNDPTLPILLRYDLPDNPQLTKNLYLFSILLVWTLCLPAAVSAQSDGANRIAAIRAPARHADPARRSLPRRGGCRVELALRAAALGGPSGRCEPERARRGEPDGKLQLHAGPHRRAAAVSVRAVRTGRAGHREYVSVFPYEAPVAPPPEPSVRFDRSDSTLSYDLIAVPLREVARRITDSTGVNLIVPQTLYERPVSGYIAAMPFAEALGSLAEINKLEVTPVKGSGAWRFPSRPPRPEARPLPPRTMSAAGSSQPLSFRWTARGESRR